MPDGAGRTAVGAEGFSPNRALRSSVEIRRQLSRRSIRVVLAAMAILPGLLAASVSTGTVQVSIQAQYLGNIAAQSGANFVVFALYSGSQLGLVMLVAFVFGESITKEVHWSFLPILVTTPVRRGQLLRQKAIACAAICLLGLVLFAVASAALGLLCYGAGPLMPVSGPHVPLPQMVWRFAAMLGYIAVYLVWITALAMLLSVLSGDNGVVAVGGTAAITLISHLFGGLPTLGELRSLLPTRDFDAWVALAAADVEWDRMYWGVFVSLTYATVFGVFAYAIFSAKDIQ